MYKCFLFVLLFLSCSNFSFATLNPKLSPKPTQNIEEEDEDEEMEQANCQSLLDRLQIKTVETAEIASLEPTYLKNNFSSKELKVFSEMKDKQIFQNWEYLPSLIKLENGDVTKTYSIWGVPEFTVNGKKFMLTDPNFTGTKADPYRSSISKTEFRITTPKKISTLKKISQNKFLKYFLTGVFVISSASEGVHLYEVRKEENAKEKAAEKAMLEEETIKSKTPEQLQPEIFDITIKANEAATLKERIDIVVPFFKLHLNKLSIEQMVTLARSTHGLDSPRSAEESMFFEYVSSNKTKISTEEFLYLLENTHDKMYQTYGNDLISNFARDALIETYFNQKDLKVSKDDFQKIDTQIHSELLRAKVRKKIQ